MNHKNKFILAMIAVFAFCVAVAPIVGHAATLKKGDSVFIDQNIEGNLFTAGSVVVVESDVNGDVFVAGNNIVISGIINGDVFAAGNNIEITGEVKGDLRFAGSIVNVDGTIERNILGAGSSLNIKESAVVGGHITYAGANLFIDSPVAGQLDAASESITINNTISGDVQAELGGTGQLVLSRKANLEGNLTYKGKKEADIREGALIAGEINYTVWEPPVKEIPVPSAGQIMAAGIFFKVISLLTLLVTGLFIVFLTPKLNDKIYQAMNKQFWANLGLGFVFLIVAPVVCFLLLMTFLGAPLALILIALYVIGLYLAKVFAAIGIGRFIVGKAGWKKAHKVVTLILGTIIFCALSLIPILGWIVAFAAILWALGAMIKIDRKLLKEMR